MNYRWSFNEESRLGARIREALKQAIDVFDHFPTLPQQRLASDMSGSPRILTSRVVRDGKTKTSRGVERQRYRSFPKNGDAPHRFTPALSRLVVNHGDMCPTSASVRAQNHGDTNAARGHKYTAAVAAQALAQLADGATYGQISV